MEGADRAPDARHAVAGEHGDGRRPAPHDVLDGKIGIDVYSLHGPTIADESASPCDDRRLASLPQRNLAGCLPAPPPPFLWSLAFSLLLVEHGRTLAGARPRDAGHEKLGENAASLRQVNDADRGAA